MRDKDQKLIWESFDWNNQLDELRASLQQGKLGIILTDLFRDDAKQATDDSVPVKVTFANLQRPLVKQLDDGSKVPNFVKHWSQEPGDKLERVAYGYSIQHAMQYDSPVATSADEVGEQTSVPGTIDTIITNVERDSSFESNIKHKQAMDRSAAADAKRWKHD